MSPYIWSSFSLRPVELIVSSVMKGEGRGIRSLVTTEVTCDRIATLEASSYIINQVNNWAGRQTFEHYGW